LAISLRTSGFAGADCGVGTGPDAGALALHSSAIFDPDCADVTARVVAAVVAVVVAAVTAAFGSAMAELVTGVVGAGLIVG
tara:strand:+ start:722 stop:964 length:243 start_codon:yes stop_codon:yes gene_type:complete